MKKLVLYLTLLASLVFSSVPVFAESAAEEPNNPFGEGYRLEDRQKVNIDGIDYYQEVYVNEGVSLNRSNFEYFNPSVPEVKNNSYGIVLYSTYLDDTLHDQFTSNALSYAVKLTVNTTVYVYSSTSTTGKYYKISSLSYSFDLEDPCTLTSATFVIENNGSPESGSTIINQSTSKNFGTALSGSLSGSSSWTPTYSNDAAFVRVYTNYTIKRGSTVNPLSWSKTY